MIGTVLWYVHDHGRGHLERARAVIAHLRSPVVVVAGPGVSAAARAALACPVVPLPSDTDGECDAPTRRPFHHAPAGPALRDRTAALARVVAEHRCTTAVVDVSVETVVWARLSGLRVVAVRQSGRRDDEGHRLAWACADRVLVPQHPALEPVTAAERRATAAWAFTGAFSRFDAVAPTAGPSSRSVVVLPGSGGSSFPAERWMTAPTGWCVTVAGAPSPPPGRHPVGPEFVDDLGPALAEADLVIGSAGWASVADATSTGTPMAVVAEERPFAEQAVRVGALARHRLVHALERWPHADEIPHVAATVRDRLGERAELRRRWRPFYDGSGAARAAAVVDEVHGS